MPIGQWACTCEQWFLIDEGKHWWVEQARAGRTQLPLMRMNNDTAPVWKFYETYISGKLTEFDPPPVQEIPGFTGPVLQDLGSHKTGYTRHSARPEVSQNCRCTWFCGTPRLWELKPLKTATPATREIPNRWAYFRRVLLSVHTSPSEARVQN